MLKYQKQNLSCNYALSLLDNKSLNCFKDFSDDFFTNIELNAEYFSEFIKIINEDHKRFAHLNNIILNKHVNDAIIAGIVLQEKNIRDNFCNELATEINNYPKQLNDIILNFDLDEAMRNRDYLQNLHEMLNIINCSLISPRTLILPLSIPANDNNIFSFINKFIKQIAFPIKFSVEINPHKLTEKSNFKEYLYLLRYYIKVVRIRYDIASGHKLRSNNLLPILRELEKQQYDETISLAIFNFNDDDYLNIVNSTSKVFSNTIEELNK